MSPPRIITVLLLSVTAALGSAAPTLPGIGAAMDSLIAQNEIAGAVTVVVTPDRTLHLESNGHADVSTRRAMTPDTLMWIASMTKPITGAAIMILQDEGKLNVTDLVAKYIPEFAHLKTPSGQPANLTITQILTHTSGLGEASGPTAHTPSPASISRAASSRS
jgi:CubicO group peptidase (beta-lactamase class C family)